MLDTEGKWSEALASNNVRAIIRWLQKLTAEGEVDMEEILPTFSCWVQRTSEFAKKELLTLCFSRCQGLWMFLDRSSFTRVHMLLQRLRNLLTLAQWARRQLGSVHLWHGMGVPCVVCRDSFGSSDIRHGCWNQEHRVLKQHIWLGRLVQWWGIMGLLPKYPEAQEVKRISQMWKEMGHSHRKACLETPGREEGEKGRFSSLIQGIVTQLHRQHGCIWTSEDRTDQRYPPPNLQALLKLVLVPHIDNMSVQALLMYFVLDMANFLQCKDDLLQSFCHAFTIPSSFSQQVRAFWMLDRGHIKVSMELLLSPRAAVPWHSWQHRCIVHSLLMRKQPQLALRYLHWTRPTIESAEDAKLCADVLLQNSCVSEAWALLRRGHTDNNNMVMHFLQACNGAGLCTEALKYIPAGYNGEGDSVNGKETTGPQLLLMKKAGRPPIPLSAKLYQAQRAKTVSPEELLQLVRNAVTEVRKPHPKISEVVWPEHTDRKSNREMFLSTQALRHLTPSPSPVDTVKDTEQTAHADEGEEEEPAQNSQQQPETPEHISSSEEHSESVSSFTSASSWPLLRRDRPYVYESTVTLQRISSLLTDGGNHSREEEDDEEDSRTPSSIDFLPDCPELTVTLDGATDPIFLSNLNKGALVELVLSADGPAVDEALPVNKSIEDSQSVPSLFEVESHSFLSPGNEKMACCKGVSEQIVHGPPDVADLWHSAVSLHQEDQLDCIPYESFSFSEAATADCVLEEEPQKTYEDHQQEDTVGCFGQGFSCAMSETTQNLLTDPHQGPLSEDPVASSLRTSTGVGHISLLPPVCSSRFPTQLQQTSGSSVTPILTYNIKATSAPSDTTNESPPKVPSETDEPCVQSTSACLDRCKMGTWWKKDPETCRASSGPLCTAGAAITPDNVRPSFVLSQPYSYSPVNFMDFTAEQKGDKRDGKQADKEEPAGVAAPLMSDDV
ncbi:uncharacterized protein [Chaetodon trifascialis]|uniref:uncharacterized protein n=1 Tax=Chaetodon trifascialis TaxID=109706 RepID=UPI00399588F3